MSNTQQPPILSLSKVAKHFGPVTALKRMDFQVERGRVHTLLGENGAGKSTLMKILAGVHSLSAGEMRLRGKPYAPATPQDAARSGLAIVFQELSLCNNLSVAENILATREPSRLGWISDAKLVARAKALVDDLGLPINVHAKVGDLSMAQRQLVEIAKGLSHDADVVILDEPTSSLSDSEAEILFRIIDRLTERGKAVIYISHRMEEIMRLSDDITVVRDGEYITTLKKDETTTSELISLMVGRPMESMFPPRLAELKESSTTPMFSVQGLTRPGEFSDISFDVSAGEILGFFGLIGSGRSEIMNALFGMRSAAGQVRLAGEVVQLADASDAIKKGLGFVTENRKEQGLVLNQTVRANITMASLSKISAGGVLKSAEERRQASDEVRRLGVRTHSIETVVGTLSGGNQQKVVLAKWLATRPRVLILDEPTRGVDVGAKFEIYRLIRQLAAEGTAIIMVSSELPEIFGMADRIAVMAEGHLAAILPVAESTPEKVMAHATGQHA
ncbi:D-ribose transporter ATP-binding protein [Vreelandella aquamarina]|uniref:D-ribose transporter ATP-binding protein n=1 Tax=Vreelandella aquamarina TaxID=77097 RepID=A0A6F8X8D9_9GAMM|nr:sugar ABC transporter ATP-binding protein [Halomonas meridiana]BCB70358.1 D-ribose transporter ATP-binding protein [Halomonas meridiana]